MYDKLQGITLRLRTRAALKSQTVERDEAGRIIGSRSVDEPFDAGRLVIEGVKEYNRLSEHPAESEDADLMRVAAKIDFLEELAPHTSNPLPVRAMAKAGRMRLAEIGVSTE